MNKKKIIRKILILGAWFLVVAGLGILLVSANRKQHDHVCRELLIQIKGSAENDYVEKEDVQKQLETVAGGSLVKRSESTIDLGRLERSLENNAWIRNAELYFDSRDVLHVSVQEREPIARVFTTEGASFYIDSSGHRMPLLDKISVRVPVVTGFMGAGRMNARDSALLDGVKQITSYVYHDPFWNAQIGQIDITQERKFELLPVIGDHVIRLGDASNIEEKLNRLMVFYKQVLSKVGFNKYAALDLA
ncbi:MAG: cell division protein FtsQ/DivIB, partial [Flavisolibacter sp.]